MSGPSLADSATWTFLSTALLKVTLRSYLLWDLSNPSTSTSFMVFCCCGDAPQNHSWRVCRPPEAEELPPEHADSTTAIAARPAPSTRIPDLLMYQLPCYRTPDPSRGRQEHRKPHRYWY